VYPSFQFNINEVEICILWEYKIHSYGGWKWQVRGTREKLENKAVLKN
jgi:hypothetical protein